MRGDLTLHVEGAESVRVSGEGGEDGLSFDVELPPYGAGVVTIE